MLLRRWTMAMPRSRRCLLGAGALSVTLCTALPSAAEEAPAPDAPPRHHVEIDLTLLNAGISGAGHVGSRLYVGGGGSLLPAAHVNTFAAYPIEMAEVHGFLRWAPGSAFQIDAGVRGAYFQYFKICVFDPCTPSYGTLVGPYTDVRMGFPKVKLGPRFAVVRREDAVWGAMFYPLVVRIQFM